MSISHLQGKSVTWSSGRKGLASIRVKNNLIDGVIGVKGFNRERVN